MVNLSDKSMHKPIINTIIYIIILLRNIEGHLPQYMIKSFLLSICNHYNMWEYIAFDLYLLSNGILPEARSYQLLSRINIVNTSELGIRFSLYMGFYLK